MLKQFLMGTTPAMPQLDVSRKTFAKKTEAEISQAWERAAELAENIKSVTPEYILIAEMLAGPNGTGQRTRHRTIRRILKQRAAGIPGFAKRIRMEDGRVMHPTKGWRAR